MSFESQSLSANHTISTEGRLNAIPIDLLNSFLENNIKIDHFIRHLVRPVSQKMFLVASNDDGSISSIEVLTEHGDHFYPNEITYIRWLVGAFGWEVNGMVSKAPLLPQYDVEELLSKDPAAQYLYYQTDDHTDAFVSSDQITERDRKHTEEISLPEPIHEANKYKDLDDKSESRVPTLILQK